MPIRLSKVTPERWVVGSAIAFAIILLLILLNRYYSFYASYDQGIFNQVYWNSSHGRLFQSSLSSQLSTNVVHDGEVPEVGYHRLGMVVLSQPGLKLCGRKCVKAVPNSADGTIIGSQNLAE
jgi:hypothetical protein